MVGRISEGKNFTVNIDILKIYGTADTHRLSTHYLLECRPLPCVHVQECLLTKFQSCSSAELHLLKVEKLDECIRPLLQIQSKLY